MPRAREAEVERATASAAFEAPFVGKKKGGGNNEKRSNEIEKNILLLIVIDRYGT